MTIDINFRKKKRRHNKVEQDKPLEPQYVSIPSYYSERLPISACKHKDLLDLCKDGIIPAESSFLLFSPFRQHTDRQPSRIRHG